MKRALGLLAVGIFTTMGDARGDVIHVRAGATGAGNGASWQDAFTRVESALDASVAGDEIWVAQGTYTPTSVTSSFVLRSGVSVYGGFAGDESLRTERDWRTHPTILSGDIGNDDTVDPSPFAPPWPNNVILTTSNAGHVVVASGVDATTVIDGFHIVKGAYGPPGTPAGDPLLYGSGIYCVGGSPRVSNCAFADNFAAFGHAGAIYLYDSEASISNCEFYHNLSSQGSGGAIYVGGTGGGSIEDCTFQTNLAIATYGQSGQGGAIQLDCDLPVTIARCVFSGNIARPFGGSSFEIPRGGAISSFCLADPTTTIRECVFDSNQAAYGGAIFAWNPTLVLNCSITNNTAFAYDVGSVTQGGRGAGISAQWTDIEIINCTIARNTGREHVGVSIVETLPSFPATGVLNNSIVWGNIALGEDVSPRKTGVAGKYSARNSCIQLLFTADPGEDPIDTSKYPGCFEIDPMLVNTAGGNARLLAASPCIDTGKNSLVPPGTPLDLDRQTRIVRGLPGPGSSIVDMGAFEYASGSSCSPDVTIGSSGLEACPLAPVTMAVDVVGTGPFTYQWQRDLVNIPGSGSWALTIESGGTYDCIVTNSCGSAISDSILVNDGGPGCGVCLADYNGDTAPDVLDFLDFLDDFGSCENQPAPCGSTANADFNGDTIIDVLDFLDFLDAFGTGC